MTFKDILKQLTPPIDLGDNAALLESVDGAALDRAQAAADQLQAEVHPDLAALLISGWEKEYGLPLAVNDSLVERRKKVIRKMSAAGGISRAYFIAIAAALGYTISITEYEAARPGLARCGDSLNLAASRWMWTVRGLDQVGGFARCGELACGDRLSHPAIRIEDIFNDMKPAHTIVNFVYNV